MNTDVHLKSLDKLSDIDDEMYSDLNLERIDNVKKATIVKDSETKATILNNRTPEQIRESDKYFKDKEDKFKADYTDLSVVDADMAVNNKKIQEVYHKIDIIKVDYNKNKTIIKKIIIILIILLIFSIVLTVKIHPGFLAFLVFVPVCLYYANKKRILNIKLKENIDVLNLQKHELDKLTPQLLARKLSNPLYR